MNADTIVSITKDVLAGGSLSRRQADQLADVDRAHLHDLFRGASQIREHFRGNRVRCCSIVAAKVGRCREDCAFCSQSAHHRTPVTGLTVLDHEDVMRAANDAIANGVGSFGIVNSGLAPTDEEIEHWGSVAARIRSATSIRTCASFGLLTARQARRLAEFGVQCYNHNLQTSRNYWPKITSTHSYDQRVATLHHLKEAGIDICSGALFGMGETWADRLDLAFELRLIEPDIIPINFLVPIAGTPLAEAEPLDPMECLQIIAVYRFLFPTKQITVAGGREVSLRQLQSWMFYAGADAFIMGNYLTTCGQSPEADRQMVQDLGLQLDQRRHEPVATLGP